MRELRDSASCAYAKYTRLTITRHLRVCTESVDKLYCRDKWTIGRRSHCGNGSLTASIPLIMRLIVRTAAAVHRAQTVPSVAFRTRPYTAPLLLLLATVDRF